MSILACFNFNLATAVSAILLVHCSVAVEAADRTSDVPHLVKHGTATQLVVDGEPFLCLGGELHNSSASSLEYMRPIWPRLARMHLNTVLATVSWELIEPREGQFEFSLVDGLIREARANKLRLVLLWFGSWKNGLSSYQPLWVKTDPARFPLAQDKSGTSLEILSTFGKNTCAADARALAALMRHIRQVDGTQHTVLMVQVENEVGIRGDSRDRCAAANASFAAPVPAELIDFLQQHQESLLPDLRRRWNAAGNKISGGWEDVFGSGAATDELFMAWNYAQYIDKVARAGKAEYPLPMYVNCWLDQPGYPSPGVYPSGGPVAHVIDIWHAGAPSIDIIAPDIYATDFAMRCASFNRAGNPLFIPEASIDRVPVNALYAIGKHDAICVSPFGIDGRGGVGGDDPTDFENSPLSQSYKALSQLAPIILEHQGNGTMTAVLLGPGALDENATQQVIKLGNYTLTVQLKGRDRRSGSNKGDANLGATGRRPGIGSGGLIISLAADEFLLLTAGVNITFAASNDVPGRTTLASADEGAIVDGQWVRGRRLNGDETDNDRTLSPALENPYRIFRVKLYQRP
jgi:Domain of unknown function (DUF5597)/Beta-galactosidase